MKEEPRRDKIIKGQLHTQPLIRPCKKKNTRIKKKKSEKENREEN